MPSFPELRKPNCGLYLNDPNARTSATEIAALVKLLPVALLAAFRTPGIPLLVEAIQGALLYSASCNPRKSDGALAALQQARCNILVLLAVPRRRPCVVRCMACPAATDAYPTLRSVRQWALTSDCTLRSIPGVADHAGRPRHPRLRPGRHQNPMHQVSCRPRSRFTCADILLGTCGTLRLREHLHLALLPHLPLSGWQLGLLHPIA